MKKIAALLLALLVFVLSLSLVGCDDDEDGTEQSENTGNGSFAETSGNVFGTDFEDLF